MRFSLSLASKAARLGMTMASWFSSTVGELGGRRDLALLAAAAGMMRRQAVVAQRIAPVGQSERRDQRR
ncbi:hypothetical protein ACVOMV_07290 [Mesorhizobium atlanticum]